MKIDRITINDFKALKSTTITPGRVNVLIGANGSGKSTLLEALGVLCAAMTDRVDGNSLSRKGVRLSAPMLYKSAFNGETRSKTISMTMDWQSEIDKSNLCYSVHLNTPTEENAWRYHSESLTVDGKKVWGRSGRSAEDYDSYVGMLLNEQDPNLESVRPMIDSFRNYAIYQPFTAALRGVVPDPQQASPVGLNGGRLAEALEEIIREEDGDIVIGGKDPVLLDDILELIDWADNISIGSPTKERVNSAIPVSRRVIEFKDRFLKENIKFTAYDASEGALYVLFMFCLALHPKSPGVFAIDNFDQAMHPQLARSVMRKFSELVIRQKKTVFLTTHNPLVLDGLDISNDDIRLFALNRSPNKGTVSIERIEITDSLISRHQSLSQLWTSGRLGGVPDLL